MKEFFLSSAYGGLFLCVITYLFFARIQKKIHILNPLLFSALACILFLVLGKISYGEFQKSASFLSSLLTPATVALAIPLYRRRMLLVRYGKWILTSIAFGSFVSMFLVWLCSRLMGLSKDLAISFLPKSVTTAIGLDLVKEFGGISALTAATIIVTGVVGSLLYPFLCRIFKIQHPVAKGIAVGVSSHAMGTNALLLEEEEAGAIASVSIVLTGIFTAIFMNFFAYFL